jgi:hypothetical protein
MSEEKVSRGCDQVLRELVQTKEDVEKARQVLIVGAGSFPRLLAELNVTLAGLGHVCVPIEPATGLYKTFADLLACPVLALEEPPALPELVPDVTPTLKVHAPPGGQSLAIPFGVYLPCDVEPELLPPPPPPGPAAAAEPVPVQEQAEKPRQPDMRKPVNWKIGDIFTEHPRFTLPHKQRRWILDSLDISDLANLKGMDVEIRSPNTTATELHTLEHFMERFVFVERPVVEQTPAVAA